MSLDAIVPGQPHSVDNIQWVCMRVNLAKNDFKDSEFKAWAKEGIHVVGRSHQHPRCQSNDQ